MLECISEREDKRMRRLKCLQLKLISKNVFSEFKQVHKWGGHRKHMDRGDNDSV